MPQTRNHEGAVVKRVAWRSPAISCRSIHTRLIEVPPIFSTVCAPRGRGVVFVTHVSHLKICVRPKVQDQRHGFGLAAIGQKADAAFWRKWTCQLIGHGVVNEERIGARKRRDIAVRPMHCIAIEQDHGSSVAGGIFNANVSLSFKGSSEAHPLPAFQRGFVVVVRRLHRR